MPEASPRYWIGVASRGHVAKGVAGGFAMFSHGKHEAVKRTRPGDWVIYYSPRAEINGGDEVRAFTAIGQVGPGEPYQAEMGIGQTGWRRDVAFRTSSDADVYPLLGELSFIKDPTHWGMAFRRGLFSVPHADFALIAKAMGVNPAGL